MHVEERGRGANSNRDANRHAAPSSDPVRPLTLHLRYATLHLRSQQPRFIHPRPVRWRGTLGRDGNDAEQHFSDCGWREGHGPNAFFDTKGHLAAYGDVAAADIDPLPDFLENGAVEGRPTFGDGAFA